MIVFPAIDIKDKHVVRLKQGKFNEVTEYSVDPAEVAKQWADAGAQWLHVVDLDGAKNGKVENWDCLENIIKTAGKSVQFGGGVRTTAEIERLIKLGVRRIVLGTIALKDPLFLKEMLAKWKYRITVSLDCLDNKVSSHGWTNVSDKSVIDIVNEFESVGLPCLIYTDIKRDGMMSGPNFSALEELLEATRIPIIASGGISCLADIKKLKSMEGKGIMGGIIGKAIYEGSLDLKQAIAVC